MTDFQEKCLSKIDNGERLTEDELSTLVWEYAYETEEGEDLRWVRNMYTIVELGGRYFGISWFKGLTEMQEHEYDYQPVEVEKHEKVVTVTEWLPVKRGD